MITTNSIDFFLSFFLFFALRLRSIQATQRTHAPPSELGYSALTNFCHLTTYSLTQLVYIKFTTHIPIYIHTHTYIHTYINAQIYASTYKHHILIKHQDQPTKRNYVVLLRKPHQLRQTRRLLPGRRRPPPPHAPLRRHRLRQHRRLRRRGHCRKGPVLLRRHDLRPHGQPVKGPAQGGGAPAVQPGREARRRARRAGCAGRGV